MSNFQVFAFPSLTTSRWWINFFAEKLFFTHVRIKVPFTVVPITPATATDPVHPTTVAA